MADWDRLRAALAEQYRLDRELGTGGMATVYLAQDVKHDRKVAVKVLRPELAAVLGAERFVQEIKTTAALQHPHILPLFDSGTANGFLFYVMPFIDGETLRSKLDRETQLGIDEAVKLTTAVADALDYAHRNGVIHRDIKPENILLHDGRPMVADFGIALAVSAAAGGRMTETGMSLGTPHYMSPEQATAEKDITARSDVYSLASVLYEMLTGNPPHTGSSAQQIIMKIIAEDAQPVTALRKSVPSNVAAAVGKALEKLPADRFDSAKAFAEALANPGFTTATHAGQGASTFPRVHASALVTVLALMAIPALLVAAWTLLRPNPEQPTTRQWIGLSLRRPGGTMPVAWSLNSAIAPDGSAIVFGDSIGDGGTQQLFIKERDAAAAVPLPGTTGATSPFFSPDGQWIGFATERGLHKIPRRGGAAVRLSDSTSVLFGGGGLASGAWLDDGTIVFLGRGGQHLLQVDAQGGAERVVVAPGRVTAGGLIRIEALPDGQGVLLTVCVAFPCTSGEIWVVDVQRDSVVKLMEGAASGWYLPTGHLLYGRPDGTLFAQPLDRRRLALSGAAVPLMSGVATVGGLPAVGVSPAGTMMYALGADLFQSAGSELLWVDRSGAETALEDELVLSGTGLGGVSLSPDGTRLAFVQSGDQGAQIYVRQMPDGPSSRLTFTGQSLRPAWSPDGRDVVYIGIRDGPSVALRRRADGTGSETVLAREARPVQEIVIAPDGAWLVYRTDNGAPGRGDILARRLTGDTATRELVATPAAEAGPAISPDGRWMAYSSDEGGRTEIFVRPFPEVESGKWQVSRAGGTEPQWGPDGRELFYRSAARDLIEARVETASGFRVTGERAMFSAATYLADDAHPFYAVSRDGRRFVFGRLNLTDQLDASRLILVEHWFTELRPMLKRR